jgi:hypothetical protein
MNNHTNPKNLNNPTQISKLTNLEPVEDEKRSFFSSLETYFSFTIGSSFHIDSSSTSHSLILNPDELKQLFELIRNLFVKNIPTEMNKCLQDYLVNK